MTEYRIKNWEKYQAVKDRRPPWVKLHRSILDDRTYSGLPLASQGLLSSLWCLATENDGVIVDGAEDLAWRLRKKKAEIIKNLNILQTVGFIIPIKNNESKTVNSREQAFTPVTVSPSPSPSPSSKTEGKTAFAEFVKLTQLEYEKLCSDHGLAITNACIEKLDNYKGASGKTYKSDYRAILSWVLDDVQAKKTKSSGKETNYEKLRKQVMDDELESSQEAGNDERRSLPAPSRT